MNIIDIAIVIIIGVSIIYGMYRGFINGILNILAIIVSIFLAYTLSGQIADKLKENENLVKTLTYYTDAGSRISNLEISDYPVASVENSTLTQILNISKLPLSFQNMFIESIKKAPVTETVSQLLSKTIVNASISIISFLITFLICYVIAVILIHMISYVFQLPVLKHMDSIIGGVFGAIRGILLMYILFSIIPLVIAVIPLDQISELINESKLAPYFDSRILFMILRNNI